MPLLVVFYRGAFCRTSERFLVVDRDFHGRFEDLGIGLVAVSADSLEEAREFAERLPVSVLSDPACSLGRAYGAYVGVRRNGTEITQPGLDVVDKHGRVAYSVISSGPKGLQSPGELTAVLIHMRSHGGACE